MSANNLPSQSRMLELADLLPVKIIVVDADTTVLYANQTFLDWLGHSRDQVIGAQTIDLLPIRGETTLDQRAARIRKVIETGEKIEYNIEVQLEQQAHVLKCVVVPHETIEAVYVFFRDITDTLECRINAAKYQAVVDTAGEGVIVMNDLGEVQSFNKAAEKLFGYQADEVIGQNVMMLMPECQDGVSLFEKTDEVTQTGSTEAICIRRDGDTFPVDLAVATFEANDRTYFTGLVRDTTQRKLYESAITGELAQSHRAIQQIFNLSDSVLGILGFDGVFKSVSPAAYTMFGDEMRDAAPVTFLSRIHPDDKAMMEDAFNRAVEGETISSFEARILTFAGDTRWTTWSAQPVPEDEILIIVGRDITEDRLREDKLRQAQKMEAIGQLTGGIAHDFNNLLAAISGSLEMMGRHAEEGRCDRLGKYLSAARQATTRATQLTQRLLAFARRQPLDPVPVDANELVSSMIDLFDRTLGPSVNLNTHLANDLWPTICDHHQLENGLLNCVINSRDALSEGGTIEIVTQNIPSADARRYDLPRGDYVMVAIRDDGAGMSEHTLRRVFDPFFTTKPIGQGTGLGLSMLHGFVNQSDGQIRIESAIDQGTTIRIFLPRTTAKPAVVAEQEIVDIPRVAAPGQVILVVEDEPLVRDVLVEVMESSGFSVVQASEADSAMKIIRNRDQRIDLLLSDVGLPGMNGRQLAEEARRYRADLRVLFITGFAASATLKESFLAEGMDMMTKPFQVDALAKRVAEILRVKQEA